MNQHVVGRSSSIRMLLVVGVLSLFSTITANSARGQAQSQTAPVIEAATIKPVKEPSPNNMHDRTEGRRLSMRYTTLRDLMMMAYEVDPRQILGGPAWVATDEYDIDAVAIDGVEANESEEAMLKELMAGRFQLKVHREQRVMAVYVLEVAKGGPKLKVANAEETGNSQCEHPGVCRFYNRPLTNFARFMQFVVLDKPVVDKTGITGSFDFELKWTPDESQFRGMGIRVPLPTDGTTALPGLYTAIQEQLGLKLEPKKIPAEVLVIDHVERPSEN
jgi:uncharacterized protein (TIGR03435 family)